MNHDIQSLERVLLTVSVLTLLCATLGLAGAAVTASDAESVPPYSPQTVSNGSPAGVTVVATQGRFGTGTGRLLAIDDDGHAVFAEATHDRYFDVDPSPVGRFTVLVVAFETVPDSQCGGHACGVNILKRVNLSTGAETIVTRERIRVDTASEWHDVDRVGPHRYLIGDLEDDEVYRLDTTSGIREWGWSAHSDFNRSSGGSLRDWTHLNDVTRLKDGRVMVSLRNHDQVVFIDPETGLDPSWTLGSDDDYDIVNEQHQPDYIPTDRGGPAVVVADSENDRIVEYQRTDEGWTQTWRWSDARLDWPRDADRLPNGHTLVADSLGHRVIEIDQQGQVVWSVPVYNPYDAERLGTGDESTGGHSATALGLTSQPEPTESASTAGRDTAVLPETLVNTFNGVAPIWMGGFELRLLIAALTASCTALGVAGRRHLRRSRFQRPTVRFPRDDHDE